MGEIFMLNSDMVSKECETLSRREKNLLWDSGEEERKTSALLKCFRVITPVHEAGGVRVGIC